MSRIRADGAAFRMRVHIALRQLSFHRHLAVVVRADVS